MERTEATHARDHGRDAAAARIVRAAALRLALALGIAAFTAGLGVAALVVRAGTVAATAPAVVQHATPAASGGAERAPRDDAAPVLRTDI